MNPYLLVRSGFGCSSADSDEGSAINHLLLTAAATRLIATIQKVLICNGDLILEMIPHAYMNMYYIQNTFFKPSKTN